MKKANGPTNCSKRDTDAEPNPGMKSGARGGIEKVRTGISGFDELLAGGIPKGRAMLLLGAAGTGKTVLLNEFLYRGITTTDENGVFVTMEERPKDIIKNVESFGWNYTQLLKQKRLAFVDASQTDEILQEMDTDYDLTPLVARIKYAIKKVKAKRVGIDCLDALFSRFTNKEIIRSTLYRISDELKEMGVTSMITAEKSGGDNVLSRYGMAEFVADGVIELDVKTGQQQFVRTIYVRKMRGTTYRSGVVEFDISHTGIKVYPKIPLLRDFAATSFTVRKRFGIKGLDDALHGGVPQGHMMLVSGNTGTGKTFFCTHFLLEGIENGENGVYVALEEPVGQLRQTSLEHDWDFVKHEKAGALSFVCPSIIDISSDKLLYDIVNAVQATNATRVVIDSISSLESATMNPEQVRQFLIQLTGYFKTKGVTCIMSYLVSSVLGASSNQLMAGIETNEMRLSSIIDGIILLRYVERDQEIHKLLHVLKLRGSCHDKDIYRYWIEKGGVVMGEKYKA